jgi:hypothetical protein
LVASALLTACPQPSAAIPLFAQRYRLRCSACHSVLPELNAFGNAFRDRGYRLPGVPVHGTTGVALRYQVEYERDPAAGMRRFTPGGVLLSNADLGAVSAFLHYNLGSGETHRGPAQGGPAGIFLGYLATYNPHTQTLYRLGLYELPLPQSPGQRLDDLTPYGYYALRAGLNDLTLGQPRIGIELERQLGSVRVDGTFALGEYKGAATGEATGAASPEWGLFVSLPIVRPEIRGGLEALTGARAIAGTGPRAPFTDVYDRGGFYLRADFRHVDLLAEQWFGRDTNADGLGNPLGSSGGYARLRYWPVPHAFLAVRYDAQAAPAASRDVVIYGGAQITGHARLILQRVQPLTGGAGRFGGAITIGFPWPLGL